MKEIAVYQLDKSWCRTIQLQCIRSGTW